MAEAVDNSVQDITNRFERKRAITTGIIDTASTTFLLLIAVRCFSASATAKSIIACSTSAGVLLSPVARYIAEQLRMPVARAAAYLSFVGGILFLLAAVIPSLPIFIFCGVTAVACSTATIPLVTQIYQENYQPTVRGRLFSQITIVRILAAGVFSTAIGYLLSDRIDYFPLLLLIFSMGFAYGGYCLTRVPSNPPTRARDTSPFIGFAYLAEDRLFRNTLICWMLMGFGNLMMLPLRVEYLANPHYGLELSNFQVALMVSGIPNLARILLSSVWGRLFDRLNFFALRVAANTGFMLGILAFFCSDTTAGLVLGSFIFGASNAGADIIWNLWITKFAPADRVASYMAVHVFLAGLRGVAAPILSFQLLGSFSLTSMALIAAGLILLASVVLINEYFHEKMKATSAVGA